MELAPCLPTPRYLHSRDPVRRRLRPPPLQARSPPAAAETTAPDGRLWLPAYRLEAGRCSMRPNVGSYIIGHQLWLDRALLDCTRWDFTVCWLAFGHEGLDPRKEKAKADKAFRQGPINVGRYGRLLPSWGACIASLLYFGGFT